MRVILRHGIRIAVLLLVIVLSPQESDAWRFGRAIPVADVVCTITTGTCTGTGGGTSLFTAATCNGDGTTDDAASFRSVNNWFVTVWQPAHPGLLPQLTIPSGKVCQFISGDGAQNAWGHNLSRLQTVGYGATINDNGGTGGGYILGCGACGVQANGTASTVRIATVSAGSSSITLLDTAKCSLFANDDPFLVSGIDTQGFGQPPNPDRYEWPVVLSTASCAGSGVIMLKSPLIYSYKSTWPSYNVGSGGEPDQGGPATAYQLAGGWNTTQAIYGLTMDQGNTHTNANGKDISFFDVSCPHGFCIIPSQNQTFRVTNLSAPNASSEFDKLVGNAIYINATLRFMTIQSAGVANWSCTNCTIIISANGTTKTTTFTNSNLAALSLGAQCCGASGSFTATNTVISSLAPASAHFTDIDKRGAWSGATLTVPANMHINSAQSACAGACTQLNVVSSAGWTNGVIGDGPGGPCAVTAAVTVINATTVTIPLAFAGSCTGAFGSLPLGSGGTMMVPGANIYLTTGSNGSPTSQVLQVDDLSVGVNGETIFTFKQNGVAYTSGLPVMPAGTITTTVHPAPSFSCTGCTGALNVLDVSGIPTGPFGSQATRVVTAANSNTSAMPVFGPLAELDMTVTAACGGASDIDISNSFIATLGSASFGRWNPTANALTASPTPRKVMPTTSSGALSGDSLVTPGAGALVLIGQTVPAYSNVGNCGSASTTMTVKTNQGVVYP